MIDFIYGIFYIYNHKNIYQFSNRNIYKYQTYSTIVILMNASYPKRNPITENKRINYKAN